MKEPFAVHCGACRWEWATCFLPMNAELFGKLKHVCCPACGSKNVLVGEQPTWTRVGAAEEWLQNGDTGISSETIWSVLMNQTVRTPHRNWPADPSDFGRCYRLLQVMPAWRARLGEVAARFPGTPWVALIARWDDVARLYEAQLAAEGRNNALQEKLRKPLDYPCYELMKELGC